ncbi:MAG: phospholipase D-like domain-containing protein [Deltaproteobacteria bacterium]|nr:phospholipase D-like domain-containing protein [Deltaproteobacteria bacterium]
MRKTVGLLILLLCPSGAMAAGLNAPVNCKVWSSFSNRGSIGETILKEIRKTRSKLSLALYGFNNQVIAEELVKLAGQGIMVRVKVGKDKSLKKRHRRVVRLLREAGISVEAVGRNGKNHNKFVVIDEARVLTGSYNWTLMAEQNWENLLVLDCPELARRYEIEWEKIR